MKQITELIVYGVSTTLLILSAGYIILFMLMACS